MKVDFEARKTEAQWQKTFDEFWRNVTPRWFDLLEWVLILGIMSYAAQETGSPVMRFVTGLSYGAIFFYLQALFFSIQFQGFPRVKSELARRALSLALSGVLSLSVWLMLTNLVNQIRGRV